MTDGFLGILWICGMAREAPGTDGHCAQEVARSFLMARLAGGQGVLDKGHWEVGAPRADNVGRGDSGPLVAPRGPFC